MQSQGGVYSCHVILGILSRIMSAFFWLYTVGSVLLYDVHNDICLSVRAFVM
jgi:hypothetical protein